MKKALFSCLSVVCIVVFLNAAVNITISDENMATSRYGVIENQLGTPPIPGQVIDEEYHNNGNSGARTRAEHYVGDPESGGYSANIPAAFYNQHSLNQTIYQQSMINHYGTITELIYPAVDVILYSPHTVKIWMAQTEESYFEGTDYWLSMEDFTLVYDSENGYPFTGYMESMYLELQTPFEYTSGNLVIMTNKVGSNWDPNPYVRWLFTTSPVANCTIHALRQPPDEGFDPEVYWPSTSDGEYVINNSTTPNIILNFADEDEYYISIRGLTGENFITINTLAEYILNIRLENLPLFSTVTVKLMNGESELAIHNYADLGGYHQLHLQHTFTTPGTYEIYAAVEFEQGDIYLTSPPITTKVYPAGYSFHKVGTWPSNSFANSPPHDAMNRSTISQFIYHEDLLGDLNGTIVEIIFFYLRSNGMNPENCWGSLYLSPTDLYEVGIQWTWADRRYFFEPLSQYTLVYNDILPWNVPAGVQVPVTYVLPEPYEYTGGNLSVMTHVPWFDDEPITGGDYYAIWAHSDVDYWAWGFTGHNQFPIDVYDDWEELFDLTEICFWGQTVPNAIFVTQGEVSEKDIPSIPLVSSLKANYPNPFNPSTSISFDLATAGNVKLEIYNIKGQKVKTLINDIYTSGTHTVEWNGIDDLNNPLSSGIYLYKMTTEDHSETRKMLLMK